MTSRGRRALGASLVAGALLLAGQTAVGAEDGADAPDREGTHRPAPDRQRAPQTSDGVPGAVARWVPPGELSRATWTTTASWQVVPGVTFERFDLVDKRGPVRGQLLRVDLDEPGISLDYLGRNHVSSRAPMLQMTRSARAIAGVNGDFFDIGDTNAPLGVGQDRQRKTMHGVASGWNCAFFTTRDGVADIDFLYASARVVERPDLVIPTVNAPSVRQGGIGLYNDKWGVLRDRRVVDGQASKVRMVVVRNGTVTSNTTKLPRKLRVKGKVLIGRDAGARALRGLKRGTRLTIKTKVDPRPRMAITGNVFLIRDGDRKARDDREMHPRTAIGIDWETNTVLLLVIDGRQSFSRGYTMVELAKLMESLGADEALNLDGGGSSTMVARRPDGALGVLNSPSDGAQRKVPNGLGVFYRP